MIKKCEVVLRNELVMVIDFEGIKVQMPSEKVKDSFVYVELLNGKYSIVDESKFIALTKKKVTKNKVENGEKVVAKQLR